MRELASASEDDMVRAFLLAELDSPRWQGFITKLLRDRIDIVTRPCGDEPLESLVRRAVLAAYRGYGIGTYLFAGFPDDTIWSRGLISVEELARFRYANCEPWAKLSGVGREIREGAAHVDHAPSELAEAVRTIEGAIHRGQTFQPLIAAGCEANGEHVLIEGHTRATAYVRASAPPQEIELIVGHSSSMPTWAFW